MEIFLKTPSYRISCLTGNSAGSSPFIPRQARNIFQGYGVVNWEDFPALGSIVNRSHINGCQPLSSSPAADSPAPHADICLEVPSMFMLYLKFKFKDLSDSFLGT